MTNKLEFKLNRDNLRADRDDKSTSVKKSFKMSENASSLDYKAMYADIIDTFGYINNPIDSDAVYITKSGKFLDTKGPYNDHQHINIANYLTDKYHYKDADANNGSRFMSQIAHAIRVTCWNKGAGLKGIYLPKQEITQLQYDAIAKFANAVSKKVNKDNPLIVATENGSQQIEYTKSFKLAERVVNDIKYYYQTGKLEIVESLTEAKAITWGDLDYAKKTDTRGVQMSGRGTGHFGTGFYFVGENGPYGINGEKFYDYEPSRPIYEIDLDKYNLFKPKDNDTAYKIHDAMRNINNYYEPSLDDWISNTFDMDKLEDELFNIGWTAQDYDESLKESDEDEIDEIDFDADDLEQDLDLESSDEEREKQYQEKYRKLIKEFIKKYGLEEYVWKDIDTEKIGVIENHLKDAIHSKYRSIQDIKYALKVLSRELNVSEDKLLGIIHTSYNNNTSKDTISTEIFKALGYEGVDVTHLNHDAQGLSGLDNFSYGTVIYDLKPGTYRRIIEPREKTNESLLNEDKVLRLPKDVTFQFINRLKDTYKNISLKELPIDKLVKDNDLLNDDDLESYHQGEWEHAKAKDFHIDKTKLSGLRLGNTPFVVQKKDDTLKLSDGRHRTRAAYNDGYTHVEYPTYVEEQLKEYFDEIDDRGEFYGGQNIEHCPIYHTDEVYTIKRMLQRGDAPYRILRLVDNSYLIQNALGNKTHLEMFYKALDDGYVSSSDDCSFEDEEFMVFIPKDFNGKLQYNTRLGADFYDSCRVYDFGVIFVRNSGAYHNSLFNALGDFEREIYYDNLQGEVSIEKDRRNTTLSLKDLDNNPNNAININLNKPQLVRAESLKEDVNKYYRLELEDCWRNRLGLFTGAFESIPSKETIENYPEDFEDLTQEERERYYRFDELLSELSKIKSPGIDSTFQNFKEDDIFAFTSSKYNEILPIIKEMRQLLKEMGFKLIVKELDIDDLNISYRDNDQVAFSKSNSSKYVNEKIVRKGSKWQVQSKKGRNLGTYDTKPEAEKRLQQVHYFKHVKEDLTKEQEDYFKNSKIRDEKGNLLICYHGTENPGFKEFDARKGKSQFGDYKFSNYNVNYFTTNKETAVGYTDLGYEHDDNVYACYLNVVNPYIVNNRTEDDMYKTWQNIKDDKVREKEISYFNRFYNKWKNKEKDLDELNKDLFYLNFKFVPNEENEDYYDLYELSNNNLYGAGHPVMYAYSLEEFFDDDQFVEFRDAIVGDYEGEDKDFFHYTVDNLIRWVLLMNEEDGTNYDGIIVPDIYDIGPRGSAFTTGKTTDIITLKSSNQIKRIDNLKPTSNNNIDESRESTSFELGTAGYILPDGSFVYMDEYHGEDEKYRSSGHIEFSNTHCEEDTCVRIFKEPNDIQYKKLEEVIDKYLDTEEYCKVEINNDFYKVYSLREDACQDIYQDEIVGNWTGYKLVQIIRNYFNVH